jgi:Cu/Ag efflux pump CusA
MADIYEGQRRFDLVLRLNSNYNSDVGGLMDALIDTGDGGKVPLAGVAHFLSRTGPGAISRENVQRLVVVSANVSGGGLTTVVDRIRQEIAAAITLPPGYRIEFGGQFESEEAASRILLITSLAGILVIFLLLFRQFRDTRLTGIIMLNLPLCLIGGIFAIWITSGVISIPAIIGFITLFGIATRHGILLISRYRHIEQSGENIRESVIEGSVDRLNPILMTSLTAALALIPLAFSGDMAGNEIQSPMAKVILGGLISSTFLNIFIVPITYLMIREKRPVK